MCAPASGSVFPIGDSTVSCTATDTSNNAAVGTFTVRVTNNAPTFTPPAHITAEAAGATGAAVTYTAAGADAEDGALAAVCLPASGSVFPIGTTTVSCTVTDTALATATGTFTVTVQDTIAPTLTLPVIAPTSATSSAGRAVTFTVTATDQADAAPTVVCAPASGSVFPIGDTTVSCTATDASDNAAVGTFTVRVTNNAPTFTPPANITVAATSASGAVATYTAKGNDVENGLINAVCSKASGSMFPTGTTTVNCTVTDSGGLTATGSFTVTVEQPMTPGDMRGDGFIRDDDAKYQFEFRARESARGNERASLSIRIDEQGRKMGKKKRDDRFVARSVDFMAFSDDPSIRPGQPRRPHVDTVTFSGTGEWNGHRNYRYEVFAQDAGEPGRHRESIRVRIYSPTGVLVAAFEGELDGGNIRSTRIRH